MYSENARKFSFLLAILMVSLWAKASEMLEKNHQNKTAPYTFEFSYLHHKNRLAIIREALNDKEKNRVLNEAVDRQAKTDPDEAGATYFYVAALMHHLVHECPDCSAEEKKIAAEHSAHYFVKALVSGDTTADALLGVDLPKMAYLLNQIQRNAIPIDAVLVKFLEKLAYDYWVYKGKKENH